MESVYWKIGSLGESVVLHYTVPEEYVDKGETVMVLGEKWMTDSFKEWLGQYLLYEGDILESLQEVDRKLDWNGVVYVLKGTTMWIRCRKAQVWLVRDGVLLELLSVEEMIMGVHGPLVEGDRLIANTSGLVLVAEELSDVVLWSQTEAAEGGVWCWTRPGADVGDDDAATDAEERGDNMLQELEEEIKGSDDSGAEDSQTKTVSGWRLWVSDTVSSVTNHLPEDKSIFLLKEEVEAVSTSSTRGSVKLLGGVLLFMLVILGGWGVWQQRERVFDDTFGVMMDQASYKMEESIQLADLNPLRSQALLNEADQLVKTLEAQGLGNEYLSPLRRQLDEARAASLKQYYPDPVVWQSLDLIREGMVATDVDLDAGYMWILDAPGSRLVRLDTVSKSAEVVSGDTALVNGLSIGTAEGVSWIVGPSQMWRFADSELKSVSGAGAWGQVIDGGGFGVNGYALTTQGVFRARQPEVGSWKVEQWLSQSSLDAWSTPSSMTIDGSIWVSETSQIVKYDSGRGTVVSLTGLDESLNSISDIYTHEDLQRLYVLDKSTNRVVLFDKESGAYVAEYVWDGLSSVNQILASETTGMMWWVSNSVIFGVEM